MPADLAAAARIESWLLKQCKTNGTNIVPRGELQQYGPFGLRDKKTIDAAIAELSELGRARYVQNGKRREIHLNPALLDGGLK
jgi:putative DNA primase/helicase